MSWTRGFPRPCGRSARMGWPEQTPELEKYYPGNVLCTAREIITLWVSRMVMMGQYCAGDIPFADVFIHAMIQDGQGRKMSKSLGNGIDPLVVIDSHGADAMRFTLASMTTQTQDVRMPVEPMELADGRTVNTSPKFDIGRNFCNKLWNASRFALGNLSQIDTAGIICGDPATLPLEDRWILSRLKRTTDAVTASIEQFAFSEPMNELYRFFWNELCDWYLELIKPRMRDAQQQGSAAAVLAFVLDSTLRLLHPFMPFITEGIYQQLNAVCPKRTIGDAPCRWAILTDLVTAAWPQLPDTLIQDAVETDMDRVQTVIRLVRDVRTRYQIAPRAGFSRLRQGRTGRLRSADRPTGPAERPGLLRIVRSRARHGQTRQCRGHRGRRSGGVCRRCGRRRTGTRPPEQAEGPVGKGSQGPGGQAGQ